MNRYEQHSLLDKNQCPECGNKMRNSNMWDGSERVKVKECGHCGRRWMVLGHSYCYLDEKRHDTHMGI